MSDVKMSNITKSLEFAWAKIAQRHPELRSAMFSVYLDQRGTKRGHYANETWLPANEGEKIDEVFISSDIFSQGAHSVFRTVLHEACHSIASGRDVQDTSRNGRYHNQKFKSIAEEVGLTVKKDSKAGWRTPGLTDEGTALYQEAIDGIDVALTHYQRVTPRIASRCRLIKATCDCGRIIRASASVLEQGDITCDICNACFIVSH